MINFSSLYDNDRQYTKKIKEQEDSLDTMSGQLAELNNTVKIQQTTISELKECLRKKNSENEHLKSKIVDFTTVQNLRAQAKELQSENELLKLETKFKFSNDTSLEKIIEMIEKDYESNVSKKTITSSMFETKNLELVKEMGDKVKYFDEDKKAFETKISKLKNVLAQRVKDFDDVKTELSKRTNKFETYFANLEKEKALLKSQSSIPPITVDDYEVVNADGQENSQRDVASFPTVDFLKEKLDTTPKRVVRFGKKGKLAPRFVRPFEIIESVGPVAYRLRLPDELNGVHDTFHVLNLKKCLADPTLQVPLDEIQVYAKLNFVEEPVEILEREFKKLKRSRIAIANVRWNSKRGPEFTWEREDQMKLKYPYFFSSSSS
ncbi:hypothetical protein Tco_0073291 [Tanacetum coccineum]